MKRNERSSFEWQQKKDKKHRQQTRRKEQNAGGFRCTHCKQWIIVNDYIGTSNRNHCNFCLWSRHVDEQKGDRKATCHAGMKPIALTFKHEGFSRQGELMLVHQCAQCDKISINRIARDDDEEQILAIFESSLSDESLRDMLSTQHIDILLEEEREAVTVQLFGKHQ